MKLFALLLVSAFLLRGAYAQETRGGTNVLNGSDFEAVSSIGYLVDELEKINARSLNCAYTDHAIQFWNANGMLEIAEPASQAVEIGDQVFRADQTVALFDMLDDLFAAESAKSNCLFAAYIQWQNRTYKQMTTLEIHFENSVISLTAAANDETWPDHYYLLGLGDVNAYVFKSLLKEGDIGFEIQEHNKRLTIKGAE